MDTHARSNDDGTWAIFSTLERPPRTVPPVMHESEFEVFTAIHLIKNLNLPEQKKYPEETTQAAPKLMELT